MNKGCKRRRDPVRDRGSIFIKVMEEHFPNLQKEVSMKTEDSH